MARVALGIILMLAPTALFLCLVLFVVALFAAMLGGDHRILDLAVFGTASQAALLGVAAKWFGHQYGRKTTWTLILIGGAFLGVVLVVVFLLKYLGKINI